MSDTADSEGMASSFSAWFSLIRPAHWIKNLLLVVPVIFSHASISAGMCMKLVVGMVAMSLAASAGYIVNDIKDATFDRLHVRKRHRPIAARLIRPKQALSAAIGMAAASLTLAAAGVSATVGIEVAAYLVATAAYSAYFKRFVGTDVAILTGLYVWRLLIGGEITATPPSPWLICLSVNLFMALALIKRIDEVSSISTPATMLLGRGYTHVHRSSLLAGTGFFAFATVITILGYLAWSNAVVLYYRDPVWLWGTAVVVCLWLVHLWRRAIDGTIGGDPVMFAAADPVSLALVGLGTAAYIQAV
ncbi:UbiA prenyltransferase family protein [Mesorhizobium sp. L2C085B000]|uniref:UbiA prenyltransferase family protein n=1 Tax=Mesorhizobium sp. L2C085B000 TaxID=1287117 RepID=UPI0018CA3151|nr:UbiA prenyltransferase family protein [Mesorhizobium sp. L2C085B000]